MKYAGIERFEDEKFRRLTGVKRTRFEKMLEILRESAKKKQAKGGRKPKLLLEDQLLMALEYIREYHPYFHVSQSYGVSESTCHETIKWIENTLIKHPDFRLFKESGVRLLPEIKTLTDTGYQGITKLHPNAELPKKKAKKNPLTKEEKRKDRELSSERVLNENVIGMLKRFKIVSDRYRNRRNVLV